VRAFTPQGPRRQRCPGSHPPTIDAYPSGHRCALAIDQGGLQSRERTWSFYLFEGLGGNSLVGKGNKSGSVAIPPHAAMALDLYLASRGIPNSPKRWKRDTALLGSLGEDELGLTGARLWAIMKRFFRFAAVELESADSELAEKLRRASPHWMRHTHATHALARGAALTTVRDNLRHASVSTTSAYLHTDRKQRATEMTKALTAGKPAGYGGDIGE
jgi:integrase